jgi:hypothetical protein
MKERNKYYDLDEIGFVGVQDEKNFIQVQKDIEQTVQYIKDKKAVKPRSSRLTKKTSATKAK